jgi:hypothetical protein
MFLLCAQVVNEYTDWERTVQHPVNTKDACVQALSDAQFVAPLVQTGDLFTLRHTKKPNNPHISPVPDSEKEPMPKTYFYVFDYQMKDGDYPQVRHRRVGSIGVHAEFALSSVSPSSAKVNGFCLFLPSLAFHSLASFQHRSHGHAVANSRAK